VALTRRAVLGSALAAAAVAVAGCDAPTAPTEGATDPATATGLTGSAVPTATATQQGPTPDAMAPTAAALTVTLTRYLAPTPDNPSHPTYAGAVALVLTAGRVAARAVVGAALRYGAGPVELPPSQRVAMRADSVFDLASITKVYVAILTLQQVDQGRLDLDAPVVQYLPGFTGDGKAAITVAQLLAHTSGLPVGVQVSGLPDDTARRAAVLATPLVPGSVPGGLFRYSSAGFMVLGQLVEKLTGERLDTALAHGITTPLGLRETGFLPKTWLSADAQQARLVATDARSSRGLLRGVVHDDVANTMGGIAGHAGIFATAADVAVIAEMLHNGGIFNGVRVLSSAIVDRMHTNANPNLPATDPDRPHRTADHGLGLELNQPWFMGRLATPMTFGHTGFTGTSMLVDPTRKTTLIVLTNRAHPNWSWANPDPMRAAVADMVSR
jgi:CubicO group peptidase (beta-lactamase class C family)